MVGAAAVFALLLASSPTPSCSASSLGTVLYAASTIGIMAVPVALLMIGGEFDLSAGVLVTTSALISSMFSYQLTANDLGGRRRSRWWSPSRSASSTASC